jgi:hypothetical protein
MFDKKLPDIFFFCTAAILLLATPLAIHFGFQIANFYFPGIKTEIFLTSFFPFWSIIVMLSYLRSMDMPICFSDCMLADFLKTIWFKITNRKIINVLAGEKKSRAMNEAWLLIFMLILMSLPLVTEYGASIAVKHGISINTYLPCDLFLWFAGIAYSILRWIKLPEWIEDWGG